MNKEEDVFRSGSGAGGLFLQQQIDRSEHSALVVVKLQETYFYQPHGHKIGCSVRAGQVPPLLNQNGFVQVFYTLFRQAQMEKSPFD